MDRIESIDKLKLRCLQSKKSLLGGKRSKWRHIDRGGTILGVAHCDSVTCGTNAYRKEGELVYSTSLDDRLGVHILLDILPSMGIVCDVLLTDDEESGNSSAQYAELGKQYNWIFQFDRRGTDCVTYEYDSMIPHAKKHFQHGQGSFSDICWLEHLGIGGMNIGTGYYNEHTLKSYANLAETMAQVERFRAFYKEYRDIKIPHIPKAKPATNLWWHDDSPTICAGDTDWDYGAAKLCDLDAGAQLLGYDDLVDLILRQGFDTSLQAIAWLEAELWERETGYSQNWKGEYDAN